MIRSFALTYAAVTLRVYLAVLPALPLAFITGYRAVSFLCWVPNLLLAELLLRQGRQRSNAALGQTTSPARAVDCSATRLSRQW